MSTDKTDRRAFLAASVAGAAAAVVPTASRAEKPVSSRLRLGFIGTGNRAQGHLSNAAELFKEDKSVEIAAVCDVFNRSREYAAGKARDETGLLPYATGDYREILADESIDAVVISTPDHWHAQQTLDALAAGKHVYCEKPMTHTVDEAIAVLRAWRESGLVMQVGVQSTSLPVWSAINEQVQAGALGKILMYQTEYFRNSDCGQWRGYSISRDMTPQNIDWKMFLGTEQGLAPDMPFDRAKYAQWRCYWDFGSGVFTDLFVHRTTTMLKATGLRFPGRVMGAGGIYLEYDGRDVPDVATVVADFDEGVQGLVTATMACENTPIRQTIRGHLGSIVPTGGTRGPGVGEDFSAYDFVAERPQVTHDSSIKDRHVEIGGHEKLGHVHFANFLDAVRSGNPGMVNCSPELGAAAMTIVKLGVMSYRGGKAYHFDKESLTYADADSSWASRWEQRSQARASALHVPGWKGGDRGSVLLPRPYQSLEGPWINGIDPADA